MAFGKWGHFILTTFLAIFLFQGLKYRNISRRNNFFSRIPKRNPAPYTSFVKDATLADPAEYYDYIIIGGGTAGCALAATLSISEKVLLLERGGLADNCSSCIHITGYVPTLMDTSPSSVAQSFVTLDGVFNHRARVLGGGSAINAGFYTRTSAEYIGEAGWDPQLVNESYEWLERKVAHKPQVLKWQTAVKNGLLEVGVSPDRGFTHEHMQGTKIGGTIFDENGYRHSAADLLEYADPTMITIYLHATVTKILFTNLPGQRPKAYGVAFKDSKGNKHITLLSGKTTSEVIVSAGALGSPQVLMLSGIGPSHQLKAHGLDVILDQPMVGQGMSDNPMNLIFVPSPKPVETSLVEVVGIDDEFGFYIETASGFMDFYIETASGFLSFFLSIIPFNKLIAQSGVIYEKVARPFSTGHLELKNSDPNENPLVQFNYFQDPRDLQKCVQGMKVIREVYESQAFSMFRYSFISFEFLMKLVLAMPNNLRKKHLLTWNHSLEQFCIDTVMTIWHYHGGCQVDRVVDSDYRVLGVDSLRVVDGSTFYNSPGTNPQATVMMLGRYVGQKILREKQRD